MNIKLIVWDLDDTLWRGSLAENADVSLLSHRADCIRLLNSHGIVSAICSKNDFDSVKKRLIAFGLWDEFVFPRISFSPKAPVVKQLIADMQLQPENVLFIDDNVHNLHAVKFLLPDIFVLDATTDFCDQTLDALVQQNKDISHNRVKEYRMIEARVHDAKASKLPEEEFLRSCNIRVALVHRMDNLDFAPRIEELINRSNQLNFTKSRVEAGAILDLASDILNYDCFSIFVWDNYGYHGLVGFAAIAKDRKIVHFVFSCRVMHMGIENWTLNELKRFFPRLDLTGMCVIPARADWICEESFHESAIRSKIYENEFPTIVEPPRLRIMANCQSGAIAHFSGLASVAMFDNAPRAFNPKNVLDRVFYLRYFMSEKFVDQHYPEMLVYGAFVDYANGYWPGISDVDLEATIYPKCVRRFCDFVQNSGRTALVILPFEDAPDHKIPGHFGVTLRRLGHFNRVWRRAAKAYDSIEILDLNFVATEAEAIDVRHYSVALLKKIAERTRCWYNRKLASSEIQAGRSLKNYRSDDSSGVTGAAGGAVTGAVVGGPIGAAVGGVTGAIVGGAVGARQQVLTYVQQEPLPLTRSRSSRR